MSYPIISSYFNLGKIKSISVKITCPGNDNYGTGTLIKDDGYFYVLTAAHVIMNGNDPFDIEEIKIEGFWSQNARIIKGVKIVKTNPAPDKDYAIIRVDEPEGCTFDFDNCLLVVKECEETFPYRSYGFSKGGGLTGRVRELDYQGSGKWKVKDEISTVGLSIDDVMRGQSGAGVFATDRNRLYLVGFVKSTVNDGDLHDDISVLPMSVFNYEWKTNWYDNIETASGVPMAMSRPIIIAKNPISCEDKISYRGLWSDLYMAIMDNADLTTIIGNIEKARKRCPHPDNIYYQDLIIRHLINKKEAWTNEEKQACLMAMRDEGAWPNLCRDMFRNAENIAEFDLYKKLEERGKTLTNPSITGTITSDEEYYEEILRAAYSFEFDKMYDLLQGWTPVDSWHIKKAVLMRMFQKDAASHDKLADFIDVEGLPVEIQYEAIQAYNIIDDNFRKKYSTAEYQKANINSVCAKITDTIDNIDKGKKKVDPYGTRYTMTIGGEDYRSFPESVRALQLLIDTGFTTNLGFIGLLPSERWYKVCRYLLHLTPYPILFYSLQYQNEKLLRRLGQDFAYRNDESLRERVPEILVKLIHALKNNHIPNGICYGIYYFTSELYVAVEEDIWYPVFKEVILDFMCQHKDFRFLSYSDPIVVNVRSALNHLLKKQHRQEVFGLLLPHITDNLSIVNMLINDTLTLDEDFFATEELQSKKAWLINDCEIKDNYCLVYKLKCTNNITEAELARYDEKIKSCDLNFAKDDPIKQGMLLDVAQDEVVIASIKQYVLEKDMWKCGVSIENGSFTLPQSSHLERIDTKIKWAPEEWSHILGNIRLNLGLLNLEKTISLHDSYFTNEYLRLLIEMRQFLSRQKNDNHYDDEGLIDEISKSINQKRGYSNIYSALLSDNYNMAREAAMHLFTLAKANGISKYIPELSLLINSVIMKQPLFIYSAVDIIDALLDIHRADMVKFFGKQIEGMLESLYEYDYEQLDVRVPEFNRHMRNIAKALLESGTDNRNIRYWIEDSNVNRYYFQ